jgi:predicted deacylase
MDSNSVVKHVFESGKAGPHLVVLGAIHGNETCGPNALQKVIAEIVAGTLKIVKGRCTIVPICNPEAYARRVRFVEENLNRVFLPVEAPESYERKLAAKICPWVAEADVLLDLHSMQSNGDPFVFLNAPTAESRAFCEALGARYILEGWPDVYAAHPELLSSCTQTFADRQGIPNALVECGRHQDPAADLVAYDSVMRALRYLGMIEGGVAAHAKSRRLRMTSLHVRHSTEDRFPKTWGNFEAFRKGDLLALQGDGREIRAEEDGIMILPSFVSLVGTEWFYTGRVLED